MATQLVIQQMLHDIQLQDGVRHDPGRHSPRPLFLDGEQRRALNTWVSQELRHKGARDHRGELWGQCQGLAHAKKLALEVPFLPVVQAGQAAGTCRYSH